MAATPYISVILPAYNCERFISDSIKSVLSQSYKDFELIIVDDGSTDGTADIIRAFSQNDTRIKTITQANQGVSAARNVALATAQGEFVTFIDADDSLDKDFLNICLRDCSTYDIIAAAITHDMSALNGGKAKFRYVDPLKYLADVLYKKLSSPSVCGKLFRRSLFDGVRFWTCRYEDLEIFPRLVLKCYRLALTDSKLYFYRVNPDSFIHSIDRSRFDSLKATDSIVSFISAEGDHFLTKAAKCRHLSAAFNAFCISYGKDKYRSEQSEARKIIKSTRKEVLLDASAPVKIKLGILASFFGWRMLSMLNRIFKISS